MRVLFTSARHSGFVLPLLQLARAMVEHGDTVYFLTGEAFRQPIEAAGATFLRVPYDEAHAASRVEPKVGTGRVRELGVVLHALFLDTIEADHGAVLEHVRTLGIDLIVTEPLFVGASMLGLLPREQRPGILSVGLFPLPFTSPDTAPYGSGMPPVDAPLNAIRNRAIGLIADHVHMRSVRRAFAREVKRLTGVRISGPLFDLALTVDAYAQMTVPQFEYPRRDLSPKVRFVGPLPPPRIFALPDWWDYADPRPIVHVTQGTYSNADPTELIVPTIRALADEDVLVVATTGGPDPATIRAAYGGPLPDNARVERFMPYDHLLAAASVMVTNGGYGSVHHAMRWGLPLVVAGTSEGRAEVNARVAWCGAGLDLRQQRPEAATIRAAVLQLLDSHDVHRRSSARFGAAIAATDPLASLLALADEVVAAGDGRATVRASASRTR